jgi:ribosomal protein L12E/L44/L45/RPP1/RPP2
LIQPTLIPHEIKHVPAPVAQEETPLRQTKQKDKRREEKRREEKRREEKRREEKRREEKRRCDVHMQSHFVLCCFCGLC